MTTGFEMLRDRVRAHLPATLPPRLGVAVSGGSDSTALMHLMADISRREGIALFVATVDHGLRDEAADEAKTVAAQAQELGLPHETLRWQGWDGLGNLQDQARRARYRLLTQWAEALGLGAIVLGHTADDQAETVLMRLARSSGVSGLSGMAHVRSQGNVKLLRPMLSVTRAELRNYLTDIGVKWIEDPSNRDHRFDRIKARKALEQLDPLGITTQTLTDVAENLERAGEALAQYAQDSARQIIRVDGGDLTVDRQGFVGLPEEIRRRIIIAAVTWIAGRDYPPRQSTIDRAQQALSAGQTLPIGGCLLVPDREKTWICRELKPVGEVVTGVAEAWDDRWIVTGPVRPNVEVRALGENGILRLSDWRELGKPRKVLLSSPAVWSGETLLAAPLAGLPGEWHVKLSEKRPEFFASILSH
ncbi:MAG: tRNA lysidine(34) synthetase TilS [Ruegeria sp.]